MHNAWFEVIKFFYITYEAERSAEQAKWEGIAKAWEDRSKSITVESYPQEVDECLHMAYEQGQTAKMLSSIKVRMGRGQSYWMESPAPSIHGPTYVWTWGYGEDTSIPDPARHEKLCRFYLYGEPLN